MDHGQTPLPMEFSRQEYWSRLPFPSPIPKYEVSEVSKVKSVAQSCPTLSDPMDCSPPGAPVHGIFQAILLEWIAIAFSVLSLRHLISSFGKSKQGDTKEQAKIRNRTKKEGRMKTKIQIPDLSAFTVGLPTDIKNMTNKFTSLKFL